MNANMPAFLPPATTGVSALHGRQLNSPKQSTSAPTAYPLCHRPRNQPVAKLPDVVIIGGGLVGLSTAYELSLKGASVQILTTRTRKPAGLAAAGMLAPNAEFTAGPLHKLCETSLAMYPRFVRRLEAIAPGSDLRFVSRADLLQPQLVGQPAFAADEDPRSVLLTGAQARVAEPSLGPRVVAARRLKGEAHVDNRELMHALRVACNALGVDVREDALVRKLVIAPGAEKVDAVVVDANELVSGGHYLLASGAWTSSLLPGLPVRPIKGQMLALKPPAGEEPVGRLNHLLYGHDVYIVPKKDGEEFYVGATEEEGTFSTHNTARGIAQLLSAAVELVPALADYEIVETWTGIRPTTPDLLPILGMSEFVNMSIATGCYRNGILLAPVTARVAAATALDEVNELPSELWELLDSFSCARFLRSDDSSAAVVDEAPRQNVPTPSEQVHAVGQSKEQAEDLSQVKVWRILPDGTREPVLPPKKTSGVGKGFSRATRATEIPAQPDQVYSSVEPSAFSYRENVPNPEAISGENDAYEDVMQHRGDDAEKTMKEAMAENRAFGRTKSSLEKDGVPPLSISEEEVIAFDAALAKGLEDMKEVENTFDENHPSVVATKAELARTAQEQDQDKQVHAVNGSASALLGLGASSSNAEGPSGYY